MHDWPQRLSKLSERGATCVVVTVAGIRGSAPRETGSKMIVTADGVQGTIGGGQLEHGCIDTARRHLDDLSAPGRALRRFALGSQCGQCCGGVVDVLFERVAPGMAWVDSAFNTVRAGARAALVTALADDRNHEARGDASRHREARGENSRHREARGDNSRHRKARNKKLRHREERSDAAIPPTARQRPEIAAPAARARNDGEARGDNSRHREERSDAAISPTARQRPEIAAPAARARNDGEDGQAHGDAPRHREARNKKLRHREERSDAANSQTTRPHHDVAAPAARARNDGEARGDNSRHREARNNKFRHREERSDVAISERRRADKQVVTSAAIGAVSPVDTAGDTSFADPAMQRALRAAVKRPGSACVVRGRTRDGAARSYLVEPVGPPPLTVVIFGAGHVGRACAQVLGTLDAAVFVIDSRAEQLQGHWPDNVTPAFIASPTDFVAHCPPDTCYLVMTHDHGLDLDLCREILARPDRRFSGLIGSVSKRRRFEKRLRAAGYDDAALASLTCPIGADGITGKHPGEIAVAVAAQLLTLTRRAAEPTTSAEDNVAVFPGRAPGGRSAH